MEREATKVLSGEEYDHLFPKALLTTIVKKKGATVKDTLKLIPQVVNETLWQTHKIAEVLKGRNLEETCRNIWEFVYRHIAYRKDENGKEQVRSPARTWHDRHNSLTDKNGNKVPGGVDCDCGTTFISSILSNLKIRHRLRIVKFADSFGRTNDFYSHIYPIVPKPGGGHYTVDFVVHRFNYEEPFREKHDTNMDLEYLNGVYNSELKSTDAIDLSGAFDDGDAFSDLGKLFKKKSSSGGGGGSAPPKKKIQLKQVVKNVAQKAAPVKQVFQKGGVKKVIQNTKQAVKNVNIKQVAKKVLNVANKLNPAVVPLRAGVLASMKINFMKVAQRLKYSYLSDAEAQRRGIDMDKFQKLKQVRTKLENIFYSAGGKPENLKSAILTGKGNKNRDVVAGLGYVSEDVYGIDQYTPLSQLLGDAYYSENINGLAGMEGVEGLEGLGELGEPATAAVISAASGALTAIAAILKQIGNIFKSKNRDSQDYAEAEAKENSQEEETSEATQQSNSSNQASPSERQDNSSSIDDSGSDYSSNSSSGGGSSSSYSNSPSSSSSSSNSSQGNYNDSGEEGNDGNDENENSNQDQLPATTSNSSNLPAAREATSSTSPAAPQTFWQKNKTWLLPTSIGSGILLICIGGYMILKKPSENKPQKQNALSGIPRSRKRKKKGGKKPKIKSKKKKQVAFV